MKYSFIIPVYNRPDELDELLQSLSVQQPQSFEVIVVEDGSTLPSQSVIDQYAEAFGGRLHYYVTPNGGPARARNYGVARAAGEYVVLLDSDTVVPQGYVQRLEQNLASCPCDLFGGPDRDDHSFTHVQRAINYAMTSFFTTGGIRGSKKPMDKYYPRSFNMGIRRAVYEEVGGFSDMRFGEDLDLSMRIMEHGYVSRYFANLDVLHKRRTDFRKFFKQVHNSGIARINLNKRHPGTLRAVHLLPSAFTLDCVVLLAGAFWCLWSLLPLLLFCLIIATDATASSRSLRVGLLAVVASFVQLTGYGTGLLRSWWRRCVLGHGEFEAFRHNFYK